MIQNRPSKSQPTRLFVAAAEGRTRHSSRPCGIRRYRATIGFRAACRLNSTLVVINRFALKHNARALHVNWWRRSFWSQHEYWAKHAVYRAARFALKSSRKSGRGYFFWHHVCLRAAAFCHANYGPVPELLLRRPFGHGIFALSSPEVFEWLRVQPPYAARATIRTISCEPCQP